MQPADLSIGSHILKGYISKISEADEQHKRIGVAVRSWKEDTEYRESLANVLSRLQEQDNVEIILFLCHILRIQKRLRSLPAICRMALLC